MNRSVLTIFLVALLLTSCGEDRSGEYYALIGSKQWMYETMQQYYLFYEDLPESLDQDDLLSDPEDLLEDIASDYDQKDGTIFSHIDSVTTSSDAEAMAGTVTSDYPNFGFEAVVVRITSGKYALHVLYTQPDSPAEDAGLERGDWIIAADDTKITSSSYSKYVSQPSQAYAFTLANVNGTDFDTLSTVQMASPRYISEQTILSTGIISAGSRKAAYILYNQFALNDADEWAQLLTNFVAQGVDDIIIDLRYNPGGYVSTAASIGGMLAPSSAVGKTFVNLIWSDQIGETETITVSNGGVSISYDNLYILTSSSSASASELLINCLRPYMSGRIYQVGEDTYGKNVGQSLYTSEDYPELEFWLTTVYISNSEGYYDYYDDGLAPDYETEEDTSDELADFGDPTDPLLAPVVLHMTYGVFELEEEEEEEAEEEEEEEDTEDDETEVSLARSAQRAVVYDPIAHKKKFNKLR